MKLRFFQSCERRFSGSSWQLGWQWWGGLLFISFQLFPDKTHTSAVIYFHTLWVLSFNPFGGRNARSNTKFSLGLWSGVLRRQSFKSSELWRNFIKFWQLFQFKFSIESMQSFEFRNRNDFIMSYFHFIDITLITVNSTFSAISLNIWIFEISIYRVLNLEISLEINAAIFSQPP